MPTDNDRSIEQIIESQISLLPENVRSVVVDGGWRKTLYQIGQKYNLHIDKIGELEHEVFLVMIGLEKSSDLLRNILKNVDSRRDVAGVIIAEVNDRVFMPMRQYLMDTEKELNKIDENISSSIAQNYESSPQKRVEKPIYSENHETTPIQTSPQTVVNQPQYQPPAETYKPVLPQQPQNPVTQNPEPRHEEIGDIPSRDDLLREIEEVGSEKTEAAPLIKLQNMEKRFQESVITKPTLETSKPEIAQEMAQETAQNGSPTPKTADSDPYREPI